MFSVHPHGCGERLVRSLFDYLKFGSSPRLWGTPNLKLTEPGMERFIPTAVGNALHQR